MKGYFYSRERSLALTDYDIIYHNHITAVYSLGIRSLVKGTGTNINIIFGDLR